MSTTRPASEAQGHGRVIPRQLIPRRVTPRLGVIGTDAGAPASLAAPMQPRLHSS